MARLTSADIEVFRLATTDGNVFTQHYFEGFKFQQWQLLFHHAAQPNVVIIGGVGSGKTVGTGVSAATWAAMLEHFHFMDIAPTSWQASLMFDAILRFAEVGTYASKFITKVSRKPYPLITLYNGSTLRFMTAQDDIARLRGWEGDWLHGDEFGFINTLGTTCAIMRTRLRGVTPKGRHRLGRLSLTTTATDNPELWERFDRHYQNPKNYLSFTVRTDQNPHLTSRDVELMMEDIPEELRAIEMDGNRPMGRGRFFPVNVVQTAEDASINELIQAAVKAKTPGACYEESPRLGVAKFSLPAVPGHEYLIAGDPGTGNPPRRNAGVIGVFDITGFPGEFGSKAELVAFSWVTGNGRYDAFVEQYKTWWEYYHCQLSNVIECTGPQKSFSEYAFTLGLDGQQMLIEGMDLSGNKKNEALQALIQLFQRGMLRIPFIRGMRNQLIGYDLPDTKLAQDIVSMMMVAAAWLRTWRIWGHDVDENELDEDDPYYGWHANVNQVQDRSVRSAPLESRPR